MRSSFLSIAFASFVLAACGAEVTPTSPRDGTVGQGAGASYQPCAGKNVGASCTLCDPADATCVETAVLKACDATGACTSGVTVVPPPVYQPCANKKPGDACTLCDPADAGCVETAVVKACNFNAACTELTLGTYDPCAGKKDGDTCTQCDPTDDDCVETAVIKICTGGYCR